MPSTASSVVAPAATWRLRESNPVVRQRFDFVADENRCETGFAAGSRFELGCLVSGGGKYGVGDTHAVDDRCGRAVDASKCRFPVVSHLRQSPVRF